MEFFKKVSRKEETRFPNNNVLSIISFKNFTKLFQKLLPVENFLMIIINPIRGKNEDFNVVFPTDVINKPIFHLIIILFGLSMFYKLFL